MYPTFPEGKGKDDVVKAQEIVAWPQMRRFPGGLNLFGHKLYSYELQLGDIVELENETTKKITREKYNEEAGFVKRVIGLPGDRITLQDGFVILNGKTLTESYTAKPRSTYGGNYLPDCKDLEIPKDSIFVLGDNRKASLDSRFDLGLIKLQDIKFVLPFSRQEEYKSLWRDTRSDNSLAHKSTLDGEEFVRLLNEKRKEKKLKLLNYSPLLSLSSKRRGKVMIDTDDFSLEATRSGVNLKKAVKDTGYQNILFAEVFSRGYYEAKELLDNFLEFPDTKKLLFSTEYQDIGINAVVGEINHCPLQVVVAHFGGYVPPNYTKGDIDSWQKLVDNIDQVYPSWESLKKADRIDQKRLEKLLNLLKIRKDHAVIIVAKMKKNLWLSDEELKMVDEDKQIQQEAEKIVNELNKQ